MPRTRFFRIAAGAAALGSLTAACYAVEPPVPLAPAYEPPVLTPSLGDFLTGQPVANAIKLSKTPPLLRPPFAGAPIDTPKGLAADIKAKELDVPNRMAAVDYLGTLDCVQFPEARQMLIATALEDPFEPVRYEAVMAIRIMLARGIDNPNRQACAAGCGCDKCKEHEKDVKKAKKATQHFAHHAAVKAILPKTPCDVIHVTLPAVIHAPCVLLEKIHFKCATGVRPEQARYDWCAGCCDVETMNALAKIAKGLDDRGCPFEPSPRVREAAEQALLLCPCTPVAPGYVPPTPVPVPETKEGGVDPSLEGGAGVPGEGPLPDPQEIVPIPPVTPPAAPLPDEAAAPRILRTGSPAVRRASASLAAAADRDAPPLDALQDYCIVALREHRFEKADPAVRTVYKGRTYFFATAQAKAAFEASPDDYAPAFCGMDPVSYVRDRTLAEGRLLREYDGRFYLFADEANWETFARDPNQYAAP